MSSAAARLGDMCSGHGCFPPRPAISASSDTFIDGIPALRVGDKYDQHTCSTTHDGAVLVGSSTTFINGSMAARVGDSLDCGSTIAVGSPSTFMG